ncbi:MAG: beta-N-acetylhexosaminidase [Deltaproteobacteria bacterium]|nr:MAG: beta-N-acetylhexosaminidase [Deltaproteobacteria bacterium]
MNLEQKIGQLLMVGFNGLSSTREIKELITEYHIGGVILFERNIKSPLQIAKLCQELQSASPEIPLFIAIDQEGGKGFSRLKAPFTLFPGNHALGECFLKTKSIKLAYQFGEVTAKELNAVGINFNLAPVLDVNTNPKNPIIGKRAFGDDSHLVSELGLAVIAGLQDNKVIACGKHFPGHGDTAVDSHKELPVVDHDLKRLCKVELRPFEHAVKNGLRTVMTAHVLYPQLDKKFPATLSGRIVDGLLREKLDFEGLVISDDLEMGAIAKNFEIEEAAVKAVKAGIDILLISHHPDKQKQVFRAILNAVEQGKIPEERIDLSWEWIIGLKKRFLCPYEPLEAETIKQIVGAPEHQETAREINKYCRA